MLNGSWPETVLYPKVVVPGNCPKSTEYSAASAKLLFS